MNVPFINLKIQYQQHKQEIDSSIQRVLDNTHYTRGEEVIDFEKKFAGYIGAKYCIALNSGTDALLLGLSSLGFVSGDEVIIPSNTFIASSFMAFTAFGLKPVFVDISEDDFGIDLEDLKKKITSRTKAIVVVHLYGQADNLDEIQKIINKSGKKIHLIEDACQAHGAVYKNKRVGNFGIFSAFSFYPTKNLGAFGDAGALVTNYKKLAELIKMRREHGQTGDYKHIEWGMNSRMDTIQAAVLLTKLKHLDEWSRQRQELAALYTRLLNNISQIITPMVFPNRKSVYHLYVIRAKNRDQLQKYLFAKGINTKIHYPIPLHLQRVYKHLGYKIGDLPVSEKIAREILSLPLYPGLKIEEIKYVAKVINSFYS